MAPDLIQQSDPLDVNARKGGAVDTLVRLARGYQLQAEDAVKKLRRTALRAFAIGVALGAAAGATLAKVLG